MRGSLRVGAVALAVALAAPSAGAEKTGKQLGAAWRALEAGEFGKARKLGGAIDRKKARNPDYVTYLLGQAAALDGDPRGALVEFRRLAGARGSRFHEMAAWRIADCLWDSGDLPAAVAEYRRLIARSADGGDAVLGRFRIAEAAARAGKTAEAIAGFTAIRADHPGHALEEDAEARLLALGGPPAVALTPAQRLARAKVLTPAKKWHEALAELDLIADDVGPALVRERDYWTGMTLFKMRRQYQRASDLLLAIYKELGDRADDALFHGARALSRADRDADAIRWYQRVVAEYPRSPLAAEAQYLSGWLEFNLGRYREAIPALEQTRKRFPRSKWADDALWYLGFSHYLLREPAQALAYFDTLSRGGDRLEGGKGQYWKARALVQLGRAADAEREWRAIVGRFPLSWYALLARARLAAAKRPIEPFGDRPTAPDSAPPLDERPSKALLRDATLLAVDELIDAGLGAEASYELRRGEKAFLTRTKKQRPAALATLMDAYRRAGDYNRPWTLAVSYGGDALDTPPRGRARAWWEHAFPLAHKKLVDKHRKNGGNPEYYLYAIMRKESGFDPHVHSFADAIGLLQMIPATTKRVCAALGIEYTEDLLFDPDRNIQTGSWYIGHLLEKFKGQIPYGSGSFNSGPRPVMKWMDRWGERPADEFVELVPYFPTREYMKKVTEVYARYLYLYEKTIYEQPLEVDRDYLRDELVY